MRTRLTSRLNANMSVYNHLNGTATIRLLPNATTMSIHLSLFESSSTTVAAGNESPVPASPRTIVFNKVMARDPSEACEKTLERIRMLVPFPTTSTSAAADAASPPSTPPPPAAAPTEGSTPSGVSAPKKVCKKLQKGKSREELLANAPKIHLFDVHGKEISFTADAESTDSHSLPLPLPTNATIWSRVHTMKVGEAYPHISVAYNLPEVLSITPPPTMTVGVPSVCGEIEAVFCGDDDSLEYQWCAEGEEGEGVTVLCSQRVFIPRMDNLGKTLIFRCRPRAALSEEEPSATSSWVRVALPPVSLASAVATPMARWQHTSQRAGNVVEEDATSSSTSTVVDQNAFRAVTYNILCDRFCTSNYAKRVLYPFANPSILDLNYRKGVLINELKHYNGDLLLLQEVGADLYQKYLRFVLADVESMSLEENFALKRKFDSRFFNKSGQTPEGSVIAFDSNRFSLVEEAAVPLSYATLQARHPQIASQVDAYPHMKQALQNMTAVASVCVLSDRRHKSRALVVACTHLFFHPDGCHLRALQTFLLGDTIQQMKEKYTKKKKTETTSLVFEEVHTLLGGDFNFTFRGGAYELLTQGSITSERDCWDKGFKFWWDRQEEDETNYVVCDGEVVLESGPTCSSIDGTPTPPAALDNESTVSSSSTEASTTTADCSLPPHVILRRRPTSVYRSKLTLPNHLSFIDTHTGEPTLKHTNFTPNFKAVIDHLFIGRDEEENSTASSTTKLKLLRTIPLPSDEDLSKHVAIPNPSYPSDHVALIADLTFA